MLPIDQPVPRNVHHACPHQAIEAGLGQRKLEEKLQRECCLKRCANGTVRLRQICASSHNNHRAQQRNTSRRARHTTHNSAV